MASASHEENGGDAVTIRAPPPTHPLLTGECFALCCSKNLNPQLSPLPHQTDCPTPKSRVRCRLTFKEPGDWPLTYARLGSFRDSSRTYKVRPGAEIIVASI